MIDREGDELAASHGRVVAALVVTLLAAGLAALPVVIALGVLSESTGRLAAGIASVAAVIASLKLVAAAWGAVASID